MNRIFAEATTGVAFVLTLSKRQCNTLLRLRAHEAKYGKPKREDRYRITEADTSGPASMDIVQGDSLRSLDARGLVFWWRKKDGTCDGFGGLTKAGEMTADLLLEAGLSIEATNTLSVLKRLAAA